MPNNIFIEEDTGQNVSGSDFALAAVYTVNQAHSAVQLVIDGTSTPTQKFYKALTGAWPLDHGDRVIVMKMSGTYVVVGKIGSEPSTPSYTAAPNTVFAGPASGETSGEATFRALVAADIPGGGEQTVIVTTGIFTPATRLTLLAQKLAICGKRAHLYISLQVTGVITKETNSDNVYKLGTIASDYLPATLTTEPVAYLQTANISSNPLRSLGSHIMSIAEDGTVYTSVQPYYNSGNPTPNYKYAYDIEYLLP